MTLHPVSHFYTISLSMQADASPELIEAMLV